MKILFNKKDSALIQMADGRQAQIGKVCLMKQFLKLIKLDAVIVSDSI